MVEAEDVRTVVREALAEVLPGRAIARIDVKEIVDSTGDPSWSVLIVLPGSERGTPEQRFQIADKTLGWLGRQRDERFPYVWFHSEADEREIADLKE